MGVIRQSTSQGVALLLALAAAPMPALAQSGAQPAPLARNFAKTDAILGGAPSRLAAIMAQQQGLPAPATTIQPATLQPALLSGRVPSYSALRDLPATGGSASSGRPDVFGSVALSINRTPLDRRWRKVARASLGGAPAAFAASLGDADQLERVEAVNRYVNGRVSFVDDARQYGQADLWTAAADTLERGKGDCEDYAIAKMHMLRAAGVSSRDLYLVIVKDLVRRADHAVLVVRAAGRMLVLDNGTDVIADTDTVRDYRPVLTFSANGAWTHGYRRSSPPMTMAAAAITPLIPSGPAGRAD